MVKQISITTDQEYITLGKLLQVSELIQSGGQAKWFLQEIKVSVNDMTENRRGRKLYPGDLVHIQEETYEIVLDV